MKGKVYLVGAGPGDYKLITLKGLECIRKADVIVYDRLANELFLQEAKNDCEFIYVGKQSSNHTKTQDEINEIIYREAEKGKIVTRLKGGDPYVFGRGGEEGEYLYDRDIEFEVVPGISSSIGGLCYAGIPITHRDFASSFHIITGHLKDESKDRDWKSLASLDGTLVFLMGMSNLGRICSRLIENGKRKETPVAIINWATRPYQRVVEGNLENICEVVKREGIKPPSLIVVGDVVKVRNKLNFFENKPLFGKNIVVTRSRAQSSKLLNKLNELGANAIEFPSIRVQAIEPNQSLENSIEKLEENSYILFTSENGVNIFFDKLYNMGFDARKFGKAKIVSIGTGTGKALMEKGIKADIIPERFVGEAVVEELSKIVEKSDKILVPRAKKARKYIVEELSKLCEVEEVHLYDTVKGEGKKEEILKLLEENKVDYITFTSSSTVENFLDIIGEENKGKLKNTKCVSIGPITSKTIKEKGLEVHKEAEKYTIDGIIDMLV